MNLRSIHSFGLWLLAACSQQSTSAPEVWEGILSVTTD